MMKMNSTMIKTVNNSTDHSTSMNQIGVEHIIITVLLALMIVLAIGGNILVIAAFYVWRPLREVANFFIVSLAVADILIGLISMPLWIVYVNSNLWEGAIGALTFRFWVSLDILTGLASIFNLTFITLIRYLRITQPYYFERKITNAVGIFGIFLVWLMALIIAAVRFIIWDMKKPDFEIIVFVWGFLLPFVILLFCYVHIFRVAQRHIRVTQSLHKGGNSSAIFQREFKAVKAILPVIIAFVVCWCPFLVLNMVYGFCPSCYIPDSLVTFSKMLHYANSTLNPMIYSLFNKHYAKAFRKVLNNIRRFLLLHCYFVDKSEKGLLPQRGVSRSVHSWKRKWSRTGSSIYDRSITMKTIATTEFLSTTVQDKSPEENCSSDV